GRTHALRGGESAGAHRAGTPGIARLPPRSSSWTTELKLSMAVEPCAIGAAPVFPERPAFPRHRRSGWTLTTHYYSASIVWSFVLIFLLLIWYAVEKYSFHLKGTPMRMVADPTEFAVRIVGLAHFVIAAMFLIVSPRMRTASGWGWLAALSGISVLQCWGF